MESWNMNTRPSYLVLWLVVNTVHFNVANLDIPGQWICLGHIHGEVFNCSTPMDETDLLGARLIDRTCLLDVSRDLNSDLLEGQCYLACTPENPYVTRAFYNYHNVACVPICPVWIFKYKYERDCGEEACYPSIDFAADQLQCLPRCPSETYLVVIDSNIEDEWCVDTCPEQWCVDTCPENMYVEAKSRPQPGFYDLGRRYCIEQCAVDQFIVNDTICVYECPEEAPWIVRAECPGGCPQNCVRTCPVGLYEHDQVCVDLCPDFIVNNRVCVDQCPENTLWSVGKHCMEECPSPYMHTVDHGGLNVCNSQLGAALVASTSCLILHSLLLIACCVIGLRHRIPNMDKNKMILVLEYPNVQECEVTDTLETEEVDQKIEELRESTTCV